MATLAASTYEEACAQHSWQVPERYNIAAEVCDRQPSDPHHLRFAQPRMLGVKVGDEFTVPNQAGNGIAW